MCDPVSYGNSFEGIGNLSTPVLLSSVVVVVVVIVIIHVLGAGDDNGAATVCGIAGIIME